MLNVLLVKLEPLHYRGEDSKSLVPDKKYTIQVSGDSAALSVAKKYYEGSEEFNKKEDEINKLFGIEYGGKVVVIDKYPIQSYPKGAKIISESSGIERYIAEFSGNVLSSDLIILLCPDFERIVLADFNFAYKGDAFINTLGQIVFSNKAVLSVKTFWGEFRGIALQKYNNLALEPENPNEYYAMRFEKRKFSDAVLSKLL